MSYRSFQKLILIFGYFNTIKGIFFTDPYKYVSGVIGLTASIKIQNKLDFTHSVFGMDITISNFINKELLQKRNDEYSIIFDANQNVTFILEINLLI